MMAKRWRVGALALAAAGSASLISATGLQAQDQPGGTVFALDRVALEDMIVDSRDEGIARAVRMLPARISELPGEIPDMDPQIAELINMVLKSIAQPARVALHYNPNDNSGGAFGYGFVISSLSGDRAHAEKISGTINGLLAEGEIPFTPKPSDRFEGMTDIQLPVGVVSFGPRQTDEGWRFEMILGSLADPDVPFASLPEPKPGLHTIVRGSVDLSQLTPLVDIARMSAGDNPQVQQGVDYATSMGLIGENAMTAQFQEGYTDEAFISELIIRGAGRFADVLHISTDPLSTSDFEAVPADSLTAALAKGDLAALDEMLETFKAMKPEVSEGLEQFTAMTGVDFQADLLRTIGGTFAFYTSDSTGGGGLTSTIAMVTLKDKERFLGANAKLVAFANSMLGQVDEVGKYIEITPWTEGGIDLASLRFKGLPVPIELTYSVTGDWLIFAATPQAALAAARQVSGKGDGGLATNPRFTQAVPQGQPLTKVSFIDTPRTMLSGYPLASLLGSALGNLVRSPTEPRDPGLVVPVINDLRRDARAIAQFSYWSGEDYIVASTGDRSLLVNASGLAGAASPYLPLIAAGIGAATASKGKHGDDWSALPYDVITPEMIPGLSLWLYEQPVARTALVLALEREVRNE